MAEAAKDHAWSLREVHGYFAETFQEAANHRVENVPDKLGTLHEFVGTQVLTRLILGEVVMDATYDLIFWAHVCTLIKDFDKDFKRAFNDLEEASRMCTEELTQGDDHRPSSSEVKLDLRMEDTSGLTSKTEDSVKIFYFFLAKGLKNVRCRLRHAQHGSPQIRPWCTRLDRDKSNRIKCDPDLGSDRIRGRIVTIVEEFSSETEINNIEMLYKFLDVLETFLLKEPSARQWISSLSEKMLTPTAAIIESHHLFGMQPWAEPLRTEEFDAEQIPFSDEDKKAMK
ncbi:hypothetical protein BU23DRAFT_636857 [Bimuria novae-zelandiae CBS 107.79]|uniref:Uncharacterized protein n=1 Tax=Bimuria novae-zelandiae CBS 107.79 TaxID=1447943 RepID=A0A6A5VRY4_9PLEO|nr:hypothetical protein BU23DRAFT_636857 [Bimuria novae-zelandiae CBS 107.79]